MSITRTEKETSENTQSDSNILPTAPLIGIREAAEFTGIHPRTVTRLCETGRLKAVKMGNKWRINTRALLKSTGYADDE